MSYRNKFSQLTLRTFSRRFPAGSRGSSSQSGNGDESDSSSVPPSSPSTVPPSPLSVPPSSPSTVPPSPLSVPPSPLSVPLSQYVHYVSSMYEEEKRQRRMDKNFKKKFNRLVEKEKKRERLRRQLILRATYWEKEFKNRYGGGYVHDMPPDRESEWLPRGEAQEREDGEVNLKRKLSYWRRRKQGFKKDKRDLFAAIVLDRGIVHPRHEDSDSGSDTVSEGSDSDSDSDQGTRRIRFEE